jgi:hypothetical protein
MSSGSVDCREKKFPDNALKGIGTISQPEELYYAMVGCYLDESIDPKKQGVFAVGGILGQGRKIFELDRRWEALRKQPDIHIDYFKASECQMGKKQFRKFVNDPENITHAERDKLDGIWKRFLQEMAVDPQEHSIIYGVGIIQDDFYKVIQDPVARAILGDSPYWFAYQTAMIEAAFAMKKINTGDHVAFICDEDEEHSPIAYDVYLGLKQKNPNAARYMGHFSTASDHTCAPLQAADAVVYEVRRTLQSSLGRWKESLKWKDGVRWQFRQLVEQQMMWLIQYVDEKYLRLAVDANKPGEPFNLDQLMEQEFSVDITY